jgi:hypothetical protein
MADGRYKAEMIDTIDRRDEIRVEVDLELDLYMYILSVCT